MQDVYRLIREGNDVVISDYKTGEEVTTRALLESLSELDTDKDTILRMIRS
jgi:polyhydroxyalkanoate synthesis regulator protein